MTKEELKYIRLHYYKDSPKEIAEALGRTVDNVRMVARRMGLYRHAPRPRRKCDGCQLWCRGYCIYHAEGSNECKTLRYTSAKWPNLEEKQWTI